MTSEPEWIMIYQTQFTLLLVTVVTGDAVIKGHHNNILEQR